MKSERQGKEHQVIAEISIVPIGTNNASLSHYVSECLNILTKAKGISYQLTAMGTIVQGSLGKVLELAQEMHKVPFEMGVPRVLTTIKIDDRRDKLITMESKVKAVLEKQR